MVISAPRGQANGRSLRGFWFSALARIVADKRGQARDAGGGDWRMNGPAERAAWQPDQPIVTAQDRAEWQARRRARILELQRVRRKEMRRIDYYPLKEATAVIDRLRHRYAGGDTSSILNRIIAEWADASGIK